MKVQIYVQQLESQGRDQRIKMARGWDTSLSLDTVSHL